MIRNEVGSITTAVEETALQNEKLERDMEKIVITIKINLLKKKVLATEYHLF